MKRPVSALLAFFVLLSLTGCAAAGEAQTALTSTATTTQPPETAPSQAELEVFHPQIVDPRLWTVSCEEFLYLWSDPEGSTTLGKLYPSEQVELIGWYGKYAHVLHESTEGYVLSCYITPADTNLATLLTVVSLTETYTYQQMCEDMDTLKQSYPQYCAVESIGISEEGRDIPVLRIGDPNAQHHILLQGAIHGREHMTAWLLMAMADYWLARDIYLCSDVCIHLIPMSNPDGVILSQSSTLTPDQQQIYHNDRRRGYTTESQSDYATHWKANALGTDINRNFPAGWERLSSPGSPSFHRYRGSTPFSSAEAQALRDYTLRFPFDTTVSYHAFGSIIYYEYGDAEPANSYSLSLAEAVMTVTGYPLEGSSNVDGAGYKDWAIDELGIPSLTVEVGCKKTPLAGNELYSIFFRNLQVLPTTIQWVDPQP